MDALYDDKVDGRIDIAQYDRKFKQYSEEKEATSKALLDLSRVSTYNLELKSLLYDLSQVGHRLFEEAGTEKRRSMLEIVFSDMKLENGRIVYALSEELALLAHAAGLTNSSKVIFLPEIPYSIFELDKVGFYEEKIYSLVLDYNIWRRVVYSVGTAIREHEGAFRIPNYCS